MMNKLYLLLALICSLTAFSTQAQSLKRYKDAAVKATDAKDYAHSLEYYRQLIYAAEDKNVDNYYQAAESARNFRLPMLAESYYLEVLNDSVGRARYRLTNFHLGTVRKSQAKYADAITAFQNYLDNDAAFQNVSYKEKAEKEIQDCEWAMTLEDNGIEVEHLDSTINSPNSEFGPYEHDGKLYYSSVRYPTSNHFEAIPPLARIYSSENDQAGIQLADDFNQDMETHTAHTTFNPAGTRMYYTICDNVNASEVRCKIYYKDKNGDNWTPKQALSGSVNLEAYTSTQPSVGLDEDSGKEILFFVSDRPVDSTDLTKDLNIWCSFMEDGKFGDPAFVATVNTPEDDVTPFFHSASQTLYFSSNGRQNLGGFDIYSIRKNGSGWESVDHMGKPLNSSADEMYYTINSEGSSGYMSSNRPGGSCAEEDSLCVCNDIYRVPQISLLVRTFNKLTGDSLIGTKVALLDKERTNPQIQSKENDYKYYYAIGFNREYEVDGTKTQWIPDSASFSTSGSKGGGQKVIDLYLTPKINLEALTFDKLSGEPLGGCKVELIELQPSKTLTETQQTTGSVKYDYNLEFKKQYMVVGSKKGYTRDTFYITTVLGEKNNGKVVSAVPTNLMDKLFLCKKPVLPDQVKLYFFNDRPVPNSRDTVSNISYARTKDNYLKRRGEFKRAYRNDPQMLDSIDMFFENDIIGGFERLDTLNNILSCYLKQIGDEDTLAVVVAGYASPLAKNAYNLNLTKRRINSIYKYFKNNLIDVTDEEFSRFKITVKPKGEEDAPKGISDKRNRPKESIYSIRASKERRVEIIGLRLNGRTCTVPCEYDLSRKYEPK